MLQATKGFTLIEIAIVLVIVGLLLGGLLMPLSMQVEVQHRNETEKSMEQIKEALIGFALVNGRLPCPADPNISTGTVNAGVARATPPGAGPACTLAGNEYGVVPWVTLGVSEVDAWGRRFTYRVTTSYADAFANPPGTVTPPGTCLTIPTNASFALCSDGDMVINNGPALGNALVAQTIPAVIVSHGKNGYGAFLPSGIQIPCPALPPPFPPPPPPSEEIQNAICPAGDTPTTFISHPPTTATSPAGEFDDIVSWIAAPILKVRMVAAGRLP